MSADGQIKNHADEGTHATASNGSSAAAVHNNFGGFAMLSVTVVAVLMMGGAMFISGYALSQVSNQRVEMKRLEDAHATENRSQDVWNTLVFTHVIKIDAALKPGGVDKWRLGSVPPPPQK